MNTYEIDDGHHGVRRRAMSYPHAARIACALSCGGTAVIWKDTDPKFMVVYRYGRPVKRTKRVDKDVQERLTK